MNRAVVLAMVGLSFVSAIALGLWRIDDWGRDSALECEAGALKRYAEDLPLGATRDDLLMVLTENWEVDAGETRIDAVGLTHCGFRGNGRVEGHFDLVGDRLASCELVGNMAGVRQRCAERPGQSR